MASPRTPQCSENNSEFCMNSSRKKNQTSAPSTPVMKKPRLSCEKTLDAPGVSCTTPSKLVDMNEKDTLAVALDNSIYIWSDGNVTELLSTPGVPIDAVCWIGDHLALSADGRAELWDVTKESLIQSFPDHLTRTGTMASYENVIATGGGDGFIQICDHRGGQQQTINAHHGEILALAWSHDGKSLASSGVDGCVKIWGQTKRRREEHGCPVPGLAWLPGNSLVMGETNIDGTMHLLNITTEERSSIATGKKINGLCYSPQWGILASHDDEEGSWGLWENDLTGCIAEFSARSPILNTAYGITSDTVVMLTQDETLRMWQIESSPARGSVTPKSKRSSAKRAAIPPRPIGVGFTPGSLR